MKTTRKELEDNIVVLADKRTASKSALESTIRRLASMMGYRVRKSRKVNTTLDDQGDYMLVEVETGFPVCGYKYDADLEDIAEYLANEAEVA